jgi:CHRD domain-containing protein
MHGSRIGFIATAVLFATMAACSGSTTDPASFNSFNALLRGALEKPDAVTTPGTGSATFTRSGSTITFTVTYSGLRGNALNSHIHIGTPTQAGTVYLNLCTAATTDAAPACPANKSGSFTGTADATYLAAITGLTMDSVVYLMRQRNAYINVHTDTVGGGEIRGNILAQP